MKNQQQEQKNKSSTVGEFEKKESFWVRWFAPLKNKKPRTDHKFFGFMQRLGGTFMLPIAVMAISGTLMGIGSGFQNFTTEGSAGYHILGFFNLIGLFFLAMIPLSFTIAIPVGLCSNNQGAAAFAAAISYFGTLAGMDFMINILQSSASSVYEAIFNTGGVTAETMKLIKPVMGFNKAMDMSVLGAIINGIIIWRLNERFQYQKLPTLISYIGGKRLTPVLAAMIFPLYGVAMCFIWPWFAKGLYFGGLGLQSLGDFGPGIYIFVSRLLCPTGLHHMVNQLVGYTAIGGTYHIPLAEGGELVIEGTSRAWPAFQGNGLEIPHELARWLAGGYIMPILWGLPAAGIAIWVSAKKENKTVVKAAVISGILATLGGGITETLEFLFLFVAPLLYLFHAAMVGVAYMAFALMDIRIINGGDIFVFLVFGPLQGVKTGWLWTLLLGPINAAIYFVVFYFSIKFFDLKTIGREDQTDDKSASAITAILGTSDLQSTKKENKKKKETAEMLTAKGCLASLGGWDNIEQLTNCFTRLRVTLKESKEITDQEVKLYGAIGLKKISETNYQIIVGAQVELVRHFMEEMKGVTK